MPQYQVTICGKTKQVRLLHKDGGSLRFVVDGESFDVNIASGAPVVRAGGSTVQLIAPPPPSPAGNQSAKEGEVVAPMPGSISKVSVKKGDAVKIGDTLAVMEAMKMENNIVSPSAGTVAEVLVAEGDQVNNGQVLVRLETQSIEN